VGSNPARRANFPLLLCRLRCGKTFCAKRRRLRSPFSAQRLDSTKSASRCKYQGLPMTSSSTFVSADGTGYERLMGRWSRRLAEPFLDFVGTRDDETVLDLGCGTGCLTDALTARCNARQVRGVDFSAAYVDHARRHHRDPKVSFEVGDACALALPECSFDRVLSLLMLHFVPRSEQAVAEMRRVARPGAVVGAAVWDARGGFITARMFFDTAAVLDPAADERRARSYTRPMTRPGELARAFRAAGLTDVVETQLSIRMDFECFDDYWEPYTGKEGPQAEYLATLGAMEFNRLREAVRRAYVDGEPDGPRSYAALAWAVKGNAPH
jgi:ubiquinone/menaquinone biosynthesis C-methylase UbiE